MENIKTQNDLYYRRQMVEVSVQNIKEYPFGWSSDLKIVYVLKGYITLEVHKEPEYLCVQELGSGGVFLFGYKEIHRIYSKDEDNQVLILSIDEEYLRRVYDHVDYLEFDYPESLNGNVLEELGNKILALAYNTVFEEGVGEYIFSDMVERFVSWTIDTVEILNRKLKGIREERLHINRLRRIDKIIKTKFNDSSMVNIIAEQEHLNKDYISKEYKLKLDYNFRQLMNFYRTQEAIRQVITSDKPLVDIAIECGFSASRYMRKEFCKFYIDGPKKFREKNKTVLSQYTLIDAKESFNKNDIFTLKDFITNDKSEIDVIGIQLDFEKKEGVPFDEAWKYHLLKVESRELLNVAKRCLLQETVDLCDIKGIYIPDLMHMENVDDIIDIVEFCEKNRLTVLVKNPVATSYSEIIKKICFEKLVMMDSYNNITQKTGLKERNINATALVDIEDILKGELISHRELIGEQGLFTEFGIKTSTFFAYSLLSKLTGTVTQLGDNYISVRNTESLTLLAYNTNKEKLTFNLNISNVKKRNAIIRHNFKDVTDKLCGLKDVLEIKPLIKYKYSEAIKNALSPQVSISTIKDDIFEMGFALDCGEAILIEVV